MIKRALQYLLRRRHRYRMRRHKRSCSRHPRQHHGRRPPLAPGAPACLVRPGGDRVGHVRRACYAHVHRRPGTFLVSLADTSRGPPGPLLCLEGRGRRLSDISAQERTGVALSLPLAPLSWLPALSLGSTGVSGSSSSRWPATSSSSPSRLSGRSRSVGSRGRSGSSPSATRSSPGRWGASQGC